MGADELKRGNAGWARARGAYAGGMEMTANRVSRRWTALGLALAAAIALVDTALDSSAIFVGLLGAAPLITSLRAGPRGTAFVGAFSTSLAVVVGIPNEIFATTDHFARMPIVLVAAVLAARMALLRERAERAGLESRLVVDEVQDYAIFTLDPEGRLMRWNAGAARLYGYRPDEVTGRHFSCLHPADVVKAGKSERMLQIARRDGRYEEEEADRVRSDGTHFVAHVTISQILDRDGTVVGFSNITRDVTEQRRAAEVRERNERRSSFLARAGVLLESSLDYEATLDHIARLAVPNLADWAFVEMLQDDGSVKRQAMAHADPAKEALVREYDRRYPIDPDAPEGSAKVLRTGKPELMKDIPDEVLEVVAQDPEHLRILRDLGFRSAMVVPLRARGRILGCLALASAESGRLYEDDDLAMTQELATRCALAVDNARLFAESRANEEEMRHQSLHDPLTGLPNRTLFLDRLQVALARSGRREGEPALLFLDLDGFKAVNDTLSHEVGDQLLRALPARLDGVLRAEDTVSRFGGDEFTVLCEDVATEDHAIAIAGRMIAALDEPFHLPGGEVRIGASLGMVFARGENVTSESLLRDADAAMYQAKRSGGRRFQVFEAPVGPRSVAPATRAVLRSAS